MSKPHIFQFFTDGRIGGQHVVISTIREQLKADFPMTVLTTGHGPMTDIALSFMRARFKPLYAVDVAVNAARIVALVITHPERAGAIFHVNGVLNWAPLIAARVLHVPVIWHLHETDASLRAAAAIGHALFKGLRGKIVSAASKAFDVFDIREGQEIGTPIDTMFWNRAAPLPAARKPLRVLAVGHVNPLKSYETLLDALNEFQPGEIGVRIAGALFSSQDGYVSMLKAHPRAPHVEFLGSLSREEVRRELEAADVYVLPSRSEAYCAALLEAMSMQCVCVATAVGNIPDILTEREGFLVPPQRSGLLAEALKSAGELAQGQRMALGMNARRRVVSRFSVDKVAQEFRRLYAEIRKLD